MGTFWRGILKGAIGPRDNDSRFLLDVHSRDLPGEATMARYRDDDEVDLVIVGVGAGGSVLAQRLARHGWRVVIIEAAPFWRPDEDWVSGEAGSHPLYWTQKRIIGGADPIELGRSNSGRGVGGSMIHYAGSVCPTQGAANPALTIMALASRLAQQIAIGAAMDDDAAARAGRTRSIAGSRR